MNPKIAFKKLLKLINRTAIVKPGDIVILSLKKTMPDKAMNHTIEALRQFGSITGIKIVLLDGHIDLMAVQSESEITNYKTTEKGKGSYEPSNK